MDIETILAHTIPPYFWAIFYTVYIGVECQIVCLWFAMINIYFSFAFALNWWDHVLNAHNRTLLQSDIKTNQSLQGCNLNHFLILQSLWQVIRSAILSNQRTCGLGLSS